MIRPIVVATVGYLIGIITGLYESIALFFIIVAGLIFLFFMEKRYFRYIKLILNFKVLIVILITISLGFYYVTVKKRDNITDEENNKSNFILKTANNIKEEIKENANQIEDKEKRSIYLSLIIGDRTEIEKELKESFRTANLSHVLAVSGMHVSYLVLGSIIVFKKLFGKRMANILASVVICLYMFITGFSASIVRAGIMGILLLLSKVFYRKNDTLTSIATSLLITLIINPLLIEDIGLQLSYLGTIGIILYSKPINKKLQKFRIEDKRIIYKIPKILRKFYTKVIEIISVTLSAQILILPIFLYHFCQFNTYFLFTNLLISLIIGPVFIIGIIYTVFRFHIIKIILEFGIGLIIGIAKLPDHLIASKLYIPVPNTLLIVLFYFAVFIFGFIRSIKNKRKRNMTELRILNLLALMKYRYKKISKKKKSIVLVIIIIAILTYKIMPKDLKINFVDVGQGDCTFIITPYNKTILIDGGGSMNDNYDIGKEVVIPYILRKGYSKLDYIIISHFDQDHVGGILTILEELNVGQVIISKQPEKSENYERFLQIVKTKNLNVKVAKKDENIVFDKQCYFKVIWPVTELIHENNLNNNALVGKLIYKDFSCLFTGDIEQIAEEKILREVDKKILKSTVLKVAHHGSKTSTTQEFLDSVKPQIALIGVGRKNLFGHPNPNTLERLEKMKTKIYRTDLLGEIKLVINNKINVIEN